MVEQRSSIVRAGVLQMTIAYVAGRPDGMGSIRVTLTNVSEEFLWLRQAGLGPRGVSVQWLDVMDVSTGQQVDWACKHRGYSSAEPLYVVLPPEGVESRVYAMDCSLRPEGGPFDVTAHFHDSATRTPESPPGTHWFRGHLVSNTVRVAVEGAVDHASD